MEILIFLFSNISPNSVSRNLMEMMISNQPSIDGMCVLKDKFNQKNENSVIIFSPPC